MSSISSIGSDAFPGPIGRGLGRGRGRTYASPRPQPYSAPLRRLSAAVPPMRRPTVPSQAAYEDAEDVDMGDDLPEGQGRGEAREATPVQQGGGRRAPDGGEDDDESEVDGDRGDDRGDGQEPGRYEWRWVGPRRRRVYLCGLCGAWEPWAEMSNMTPEKATDIADSLGLRGYQIPPVLCDECCGFWELYRHRVLVARNHIDAVWQYSVTTGRFEGSCVWRWEVERN